MFQAARSITQRERLYHVNIVLNSRRDSIIRDNKPVRHIFRLECILSPCNHTGDTPVPHVFSEARLFRSACDLDELPDDLGVWRCAEFSAHPHVAPCLFVFPQHRVGQRAIQIGCRQAGVQFDDFGAIAYHPLVVSSCCPSHFEQPGRQKTPEKSAKCWPCKKPGALDSRT